MKNGPLAGIVMVLAAAVLWGTTGTAQSFAPLALSPYVVGAMRLSLASVFFAAYLVLVRPKAGDVAWRRLPWKGMALAGASMAVYNLTFFAGVKVSSVAVGTAVAIGSGPVWAGLLQFGVTGQAPKAVWWRGTLLAVAGGSLMAVGEAEHLQMTASGLALCLTAGLSYAAYALLNKRLVAQSSPGVVTLGVFTVASLIALLVAWGLADTLVLSAASWAVVGYLGMVATGMAYLLFSHGLRHISGATGVTLALAEPMTAFLLAMVVVGERPGWLAFGGLTLLLAGLALVMWTEMRSRAGAQ